MTSSNVTDVLIALIGLAGTALTLWFQLRFRQIELKQHQLDVRQRRAEQRLRALADELADDDQGDNRKRRHHCD